MKHILTLTALAFATSKMKTLRLCFTALVVTLFGLSSQGHAQCTSTLELDATLAAGESASASTYLNGDLSSFTVNLNFSQSGSGSWAGDMIIYVYAPDGSCVGWGGYSYGVTNGCTDLGSGGANGWVAGWNSGIAGFYTHFADASGWGLSGSGDWVVEVENAYNTSSGVTYDLEFVFEGPCEGDCPDPEACNYVHEGDQLNPTDEACEYPQDLYGIGFGCDGVCLGDNDGDGVCDEAEVSGCMDTSAANYSPNATDPGDCVYCDPGTFFLTVDMHNGTVDEWSDAEYYVWNLSNGALEDSGSIATAFYGDGLNVGADRVCLAPGCYVFQVIDNVYPSDVSFELTDQFGITYATLLADTALEYNLDFTLTGQCGFEGCTDPAAFNYDPSVSVDDGSCCINDADGDGVCDELEIEGCLDESACNFNIQATDPTVCVYADDPCEFCSGELDGTGSVILSDEDGDGVCDVDEEAGCQDETACNFDSETNLDGESCEYGCLNCGPGTIWDDASELCVVANPSDTDFDGCVAMTDLLDLLSVFGTCAEADSE